MKNRELTECANLLGAMAHPTRLMILQKLSGGTKCVNDIRDVVRILQPNVSQHLAALKKVGLVSCDKVGTSRCYRVVNLEFVKSMFLILEQQGIRPRRDRNPKASKAFK